MGIKLNLGKRKAAYFVLESQTNEAGEYNALLAVEGETGYYKTDWFWGKDVEEAELIARWKNEAMGISVEEAQKILLQSMRKGAVETPRF